MVSLVIEFEKSALYKTHKDAALYQPDKFGIAGAFL